MNTCPNCGSPAGAGEAYCRSCGAPLEGGAAGTARPPTAPGKKMPAFPPDGRPARHAPSPRRRHSPRISPDQIRLLATAGVILVVIAAAVLVLPGLLFAGGVKNGTGNASAGSLIQVPGIGCSAGQSACSGKCVDLMTDSENCGGCGFSVPYGETCVNGQFSSVLNKANRTRVTGTTTSAAAATGTQPGTCPSGTWSCAGSCVDPGSDRNNCGACGIVCPSIEVCRNGRCDLPATTVTATGTVNVSAYLSCGRNEMPCSGSCVNVFTNKKNCGVCGRACKADEVCQNAQCGPACLNNGSTLCDDLCVDLKTDMDNCGACGSVCKSFLPNAKGSECASGTCTISQCKTDYADCDKNVPNGCEVYLRTDAANCGSCGTKCPAGQVCYNKVCSVPVTG